LHHNLRVPIALEARAAEACSGNKRVPIGFDPEKEFSC